MWKIWNDTKDILNWYHANDEWECSSVENNLEEGNTFSYQLQAKDGSMGFDFAGTYVDIIEPHYISYRLGDDRTSEINFIEEEDSTRIEQAFDAVGTNDPEMQRAGWQAILNNFKKYAEGN